MRGTIPPPRRPVFHLGVTGHRNLSGVDKTALRASVAAIVDFVVAETTSASTAATAIYGQTRPLFRIVSSLAEGADRILTEEALAKGFELFAPLPFGVDDYATDFVNPDSRRTYLELLRRAVSVLELDGERRRSGEAYRAAGRLMLDQADLVVAVWDGEEAAGIGGTGGVVEEAAERGVPVVVIDCARPEEIRLCLGRDTSAIGDWRSGVGAIIRRCVGDASFRTEITPAIRADREGGQGYFDLRDGFKHADEIAIHFERRYRAFWWLRYMLNLPAMIGLFFGFYAEDCFGDVGLLVLQPLGFGVQAASLAVIIGLAEINRRAGWHRTYLNHRFLAELLRHQLYLSQLGTALRQIRVPVHRGDERVAWVDWYCRATVRQAGMIDTRNDPEWLLRAREMIRAAVGEQIAFYQHRVRRFERRSRQLETLGEFFYYAGLVAVVARFVVFGVTTNDDERLFRTIMNEISLALPAMAPIFLGLRAQGEFARLARHYRAMLDTLEPLSRRLDDGPTRHGDLVELATLASQAMLAEVTDWRSVIKARPVSAT